MWITEILRSYSISYLAFVSNSYDLPSVDNVYLRRKHVLELHEAIIKYHPLDVVAAWSLQLLVDKGRRLTVLN